MLGGYWLVPRRDEAKEIHFDGEVKEEWASPALKTIHKNYYTVRAVPYDFLISGKDSEAVNSLRLWSAESIDSSISASSPEARHVKSMEGGNRAEAISKVLYPADDTSKARACV